MKEQLKEIKAAAELACIEMACAARTRGVKTGAAAALSLMAPALAWADDYKNTMDDIANSGSQFLNYLGYTMLLLVAGLALIAIAKEILPAIFAKEKVEFKTHVKVLIVVVVMCIIAGFLPTIINSVTQIANQGVDLGTASK